MVMLHPIVNLLLKCLLPEIFLAEENFKYNTMATCVNNRINNNRRNTVVWVTVYHQGFSKISASPQHLKISI